MSKPFEFILFLLVLTIPLVTLVFGCAAGIELYGHLSQEDDWVLLGAPPGKIERIIDASLDHIIVQAEDGRLYERYYSSRFEHSGWKQVQQILPEEYDAEHGYGLTPPYPNPNDIVQYIEVDYVSRYTMKAAYVLLKDGTIRKWGGIHGVFSVWTGLCLLSSLMTALVGFGIGAILVSPIVIAKRGIWIDHLQQVGKTL